MKTQFAIKSAQVLKNANLSAAKSETANVLKFLAGIKCCEDMTLNTCVQVKLSL